jgi:hypothetical protein
MHGRWIEESLAAEREHRAVREVRMVFGKPLLGQDPRRYTTPVVNEVAAVYVGNDGEPPPNIDFQVFVKNQNKLEKLSTISCYIDPLVYPLLFPYGELGWDPSMKHSMEACTSTRTNLTMLQYACYRLSVRTAFSAIHHSGKLFQQYVVDLYVRVDGTRLQFIRSQQKKFRTEQYQGLCDHLTNKTMEKGIRLGRMIILPSSYIGTVECEPECRSSYELHRKKSYCFL